MISYHGHSGLSVGETNQRLRDVRGRTSPEAWSVLRLADAQALRGRFDLEIARDFGIEALCSFRMSLIDKERAHLHAPQLLERLHQAFSPAELVITWELDSIIERTA